MSISAFTIDLADLADLINFDDIGEELRKSGISIDTKATLPTGPVPTQNIKSQDVSLHESKLPIDELQQPSVKSNNNVPSGNDASCPVCYNNMSMKIKLPCSHEFCLSCIKGIIIRVHRSQSVKCPLCTQTLPDALKYKIKNKPHLLSSLKIDDAQLNDVDVYWFYSSRDRKWWAYEVQFMIDIEDMYQKYIMDENITSINNVLICGMSYSFDFDNMTQNNNQNGGRRSIKRVEKKDIGRFLKSGLIKGMAGVAN